MAKETSPITSRQLAAADIPALLNLDKDVFRTQWSEHLWQHELSSDLSTYVAIEQEGKLVGYAGFWLVAGEAQITRVAILKDRHGQGLGSYLTAALIAAAWDKGAEAITLEVRAGNTAAQKAYQRNGFSAVGIRPHYYEDNGEDAIIMWLYRKEEG